MENYQVRHKGNRKEQPASCTSTIKRKTARADEGQQEPPAPSNEFAKEHKETNQMMPTTGYTPELSPAQKQANLLATLRQLVKDQPENEYWKARLEATEQEIERDEIEEQNEWLGVSPTRANVLVIPNRLGSVRRTAREIALDENGNLRPYIAGSTKHSVADNHEVHSYTWDGE